MSNARFYIAGFGALLLFDTLTQVSLKLVSAHTGEFSMTLEWLVSIAGSAWILAALLGYLGAFVTWMTLLKRAPIGPAFAAGHLEVVPVLAISVAVFGEHLGPAQIAGAACIVLGVVCLSRSKAQLQHA
ncbi:MAG: DMT family transporter [Acidobacteriota bacterium]